MIIMISYMASMIEKIIQYIAPSEILDGTLGCECICLERLQRICFAAEDKRSEPSIEKSIIYLAGWIKGELMESGHIVGIEKRKMQEKGIDFFDLVECFSSQVLTTMNGEVVCRYKYMEPWQRLSAQMGGDLFAANAYAFYDFQFGIKRKNFLWKTVLGHDNYALNCILKKGISDNHYHLRASLPYFDLSWISLMNSVTQVHIFKYLDELDKNSRNVRKRYITDMPNETFAVLHLKAALVRLYLYAVLTDRLIQLADYPVSVCWLLKHIFQTEDFYHHLGEIDFSELDPQEKMGIGESILEYLSGNYDAVEDMNRFKRDCPGLYWFFIERCPDVPVRELPNPKTLNCDENISFISRYVENYDQKLLLRECRWLFEGTYIEKYKTEWKKKTKETLYFLLKNPDSLVTARCHIQSVLDTFMYDRLWDSKDYLQKEVNVEDKGKSERAFISGERWLMYTMMRNRYQSEYSDLEDRKNLYNLFFLYLLIKDRFRRELLYNNEKIGFSNFQAYQKRKAWFTTSFTEAELARTAVQGAFDDAKLKSLELRIMPGMTAQDNIKTIQKYDKAIRTDWKEKYFDKYYYVFHFAKRPEKFPQGHRFIGVRNEILRRSLKGKTEAILIMREKNREIGRRLRGVDACSSEEGCRPEVFACAFRVLKNHIVSDGYGKKMPQLRLSYHVGEDNQDVLDGLRAIDEALYFLNMGNGDRLGHATMLGVNASEWYQKNDYMISIRRQDYLDNVVWLYQRIVYYQLSNQNDLLEYLEREFRLFFESIYREALDKEYNDRNLKEFDIHNYYAAWELRGDDPEYYKQGFYDQQLRKSTIWGDYGINSLVSKENRYIEKAALLYHAYHYSHFVREAGKEPIVRKIPLHMIHGIQEIQKKMMKKIARRGISIETNPSSNVLIGGLTYGSHPIVAFYNKGLTEEPSMREPCAQINSSINTDDSGVFMTSLSNEYALMAKALESLLDEEGNRVYKKDMVYDWINRIRKMGNEQSFRKV